MAAPPRVTRLVIGRLCFEFSDDRKRFWCVFSRSVLRRKHARPLTATGMRYLGDQRIIQVLRGRLISGGDDRILARHQIARTDARRRPSAGKTLRKKTRASAAEYRCASGRLVVGERRDRVSARRRRGARARRAAKSVDRDARRLELAQQRVAEHCRGGGARCRRRRHQPLHQVALQRNAAVRRSARSRHALPRRPTDHLEGSHEFAVGGRGPIRRKCGATWENWITQIFEDLCEFWICPMLFSKLVLYIHYTRGCLSCCAQP